MILIVFFWFVILYLVGYRLSSSSDLFVPIKFVSVKFALFNLPFILLVAVRPEVFPNEILIACNVNLETAFFNYSLVQTVAFISIILGIKWKTNNYRLSNNVLYNYFRIRFLSFLFFAIGIIAFFVFVNSLGGYDFLLANLSSRVEIQSGQFVLYLLPFLVFANLFLIKCISLENRNWDRFFLWVFIIVSIIIFSSLGGRKNSLYLIITLLLGSHYLIINFKYSTKNVIASIFFILFIFSYILIIPIIRSNYSGDFNISIVTNFVENGLIDFINSISYTYIDVFTANYFNFDNVWFFKGLGDIYLNIFSSLHKEYLPPLDDGMYFKSIVEYNQSFSPPTARSILYSSSWPIENFGFAYSNLLGLGTFVFFFILGRIYSIVYSILLSNRGNPIVIYLYVFVIFNFNFSNLRIIQFALMLPILGIAYFVFYRFCIKRVYYK